MKDKKCLRCGRTMKSTDKYCKSCRHYYETNLKGNKNNHPFKDTIIEVGVFVGIAAIIGIVYIFVFESIKDDRNKLPGNAMDYCNTVCENQVKKIKNNNCICENGNKIPIE